MITQEVLNRYPQLLSRLLAKREIMPNGCWKYTGKPVINSGYAQFHVGQGPRPMRKGIKCTAHKMSFILHNNMIPEPGQVVMHSCDNRLCINPEHMSLGTQQDNIADRVAKGRNHGLSQENLLALAKDCASGEYYAKDIAAKFGISRVQIFRLIKSHAIKTNFKTRPKLDKDEKSGRFIKWQMESKQPRA